jgi:uncharacterized protein YndB with AHSA1/START domain
LTIWDIFFWVGVGLGSGVGVVIVIALIGCFVPRYHTATRALVSKQPPEEVWKVITDFAAAPAWQDELQTAEPVADERQRTVWRETDKRGYVTLLETVTAEAPRHLVRAIVDEEGPFSGQWDFVLEPEDAGTRLTLTERGQIPNPFFRLMFRLFMTPSLYIENYLKALAIRLGDLPAKPQ